jgi:hypothetical protein
MARPKYGPDEHWEGTYDELGWIPASYLERFAICVIDGGCDVRTANVIANGEEQARAMGGYAPNRPMSAAAIAKVAPSMVEYSRRVTGG